MSAKDVEMLEQIGLGTYSTVYRGLFNQMEIAVKKYSLDDPPSSKAFYTEVIVLSEIKHPNIIMLMGAFSSKNYLYLVTDIVKQGTLSKVLLNRSINLNFSRKVKIAIDIA